MRVCSICGSKPFRRREWKSKLLDFYSYRKTLPGLSNSLRTASSEIQDVDRMMTNSPNRRIWYPGAISRGGGRHTTRGAINCYIFDTIPGTKKKSLIRTMDFIRRKFRTIWLCDVIDF